MHQMALLKAEVETIREAKQLLVNGEGLREHVSNEEEV